MRIDLKDIDRISLGRVEIDEAQRPPTATLPDGRVVDLKWDSALDDAGVLHRCVACGCREIFRRKDFPQDLGLGLVILAGLTSVVLFALHQVVASLGVLGLAVLIDAVIYFFTPSCLVCYRCRSEFRDTPVTDEHEPWELEIGEKYRPIRRVLAQNQADSNAPVVLRSEK